MTSGGAGRCRRVPASLPPRSAAAAPAILAAAAALFAPAAEGRWSVPRTVAGVNGFVAAPAIAPDGRAAVGVTDYRAGGGRVLVVLRSAEGRWERPLSLRTSRHELFDPDTAFAADGTAHVAWVRAIQIDREQVVETQAVAPTGAAGATRRVSPGGQRALFPELAAAPAGGMLLSWLRDDYDLAATATAATAAPGGEAPAAEGEAPAPAAAPVPAAAIETVFARRLFSSATAFLPGGDAVAMGHEFAPGGVQLRLRGTDGVWGEPVVLSGPRTAREPDLAVGADGTIAVTWAEMTDAGYRVHVRIRPPGGEFGPAKLLEPDAGDARGPVASVLPSGDVLVAWAARAQDGATLLRARAVRAAIVSPGGDVSAAARISRRRARISEPPQHVTDSEGDALLTWTSRNRIFAARRSADGTVSRTRPVSGRGVFAPELVANAAGQALLAWTRDARRGTGALVRVRSTRF